MPYITNIHQPLGRRHEFIPHKEMWYPNWFERLIGKKQEMRWVYPEQYVCQRCGMQGIDLYRAGQPQVVDLDMGSRDAQFCLGSLTANQQ